MSGAYVPYSIRLNKTIDRSLFAELLSLINKKYAIKEYRYIGFGGPHMEDFKMIHRTFGSDDMISIEISPEVLKRQMFNRPHSCIKFDLTSSGDFIDSHLFDKKTIIWLDYANAKERKEQLQGRVINCMNVCQLW